MNSGNSFQFLLISVSVFVNQQKNVFFTVSFPDKSAEEPAVVMETKKPKIAESWTLTSAADPIRHPDPTSSPKSILLKALTPSTHLSSPQQQQSTFKSPGPAVKDFKLNRTEREPELPKPTPSTSSSTLQPAEPETTPDVTLDPSEIKRIEFVKDYLSRVALAQAIAKQMLARESAASNVSEPATPTMESILEARWSLLNCAQLQQQQIRQKQLQQQQQLEKQQQQALQKLPLVQASLLPQLPVVHSAVKPVATIQDLTLNIISANLAPKPATSAPIILPSKPVLNPVEARKNELLASMAFMQPLPAKLPETCGTSFASAQLSKSFPKSTSESAEHQQQQNTSPNSTVSLRMFRKNTVSKNSAFEGEEAENLSVQGSKDQKLKTASHAAVSQHIPDKQQIKAGTSLLKKSLVTTTELNSKSLEHERNLQGKDIKPQQISEEPKTIRGRANRSKRSFQEQQAENLDKNPNLKDQLEPGSESVLEQSPSKTKSIEITVASSPLSESPKIKSGHPQKSFPQPSILEAELLATNRSSRSRKGSPQPSSVSEAKSVLLPKRSSRPRQSLHSSILESELLASKKSSISSRGSSTQAALDTQTEKLMEISAENKPLLEQAPTGIVSGSESVLEQSLPETKSTEICEAYSVVSESPKKRIGRSRKPSPQASIFEAELLATNRSSRSRKGSPQPSLTETEPVISSNWSSKPHKSSSQPPILEVESLTPNWSSRARKSSPSPSPSIETTKRLNRSRKSSPDLQLELMSPATDVVVEKITKRKNGRPPKNHVATVAQVVQVAMLPPQKAEESPEMISVSINEKALGETSAEEVPKNETSIDSEDICLSVHRRSNKKVKKKSEPMLEISQTEDVVATPPPPKKPRSKKLERLSEPETKF